MTGEIRHQVVIHASSRDVFGALMDQKKHA
jgi:hypothetical protein